MHFQQEEDEESGENEEEEKKKKNNPGAMVSCKVVVTRESGLQASEPTRWGRQSHKKPPWHSVQYLSQVKKKEDIMK